MTSATTDRRQGLVGNTAIKAPVAVVATSNITLSGEQTIDGYAVKASNSAGVSDRVLCIGQSDATQNGIWDVQTSAWTRALDADGNYDLACGSQVVVTQGSHASSAYILTTADPIAIGTTAQSWAQNLASGFLSTLAASGGSNLVGFIAAGTGAVARTMQSKARETVSALDYGADPTGTTACDAAAVLASTAAGAGGKVRWPAGTYKFVTGVQNSYTGQIWEGDGSRATIFQFQPTANGTCLQLGAGGSETVRAGVKGIGFYSTDSTYTKVALDVAWCSEADIEDVRVSGSINVGGTLMWTGASSIGIRTRGHEACSYRKLYAAADIPIRIAQGYSRASYLNIDIDHHNFHNTYVIANGNPCVLIDSGVNLTQVSFTGYLSLVGGTAGIKWVDTGTAQVGNGLLIENLRTEQGTDATAYSIDIEHNYGLQSLVIKAASLDPTRKGIKLRNINNVDMLSVTYGGSLEALNVDATVLRMEHHNCIWGSSSTATLTGQVMLLGVAYDPNTAPMPPTAIYDSTSNAKNELFSAVGGPGSAVITLANNAQDQTLGANFNGSFTLVSNSGISAIVMAAGGSTKVTDQLAAGSFSTTLGTGSKINVAYSGGKVTVENKTGASVNIRYFVHGDLNGF